MDHFIEDREKNFFSYSQLKIGLFLEERNFFWYIRELIHFVMNEPNFFLIQEKKLII